MAARDASQIIRARARERARMKVSKELYYTTRSALGIQWWTWLWLIGARGRGKSYAALRTYLQYRRRFGPENVKCYYFRISDLSVKAMLSNGGAKAVDAKLIRDFNLNLSVKDTTLYESGMPFIYFYPLVSAAKKGKGVAEYDPDWLTENDHRYIFIIIDEFMMADGVEKKSIGSPVEQFKIYLENILRDARQLDRRAVMIIGCANAVSECGDFLAQLAGFIPEAPGRYKLKRKHMLIDNIPNSEAYIENRKKAITADIMDFENDANYTNIVKRDLATLKPKNMRLRSPTKIIMFSKNPADWYTLWDNRVIKTYTRQTYYDGMVIPMKRHLDAVFVQELADNVLQRYDARDYLYNDLITQATFGAHLKELKKK